MQDVAATAFQLQRERQEGRLYKQHTQQFVQTSYEYLAHFQRLQDEGYTIFQPS